jgi:hypothetical protein
MKRKTIILMGIVMTAILVLSVTATAMLIPAAQQAKDKAAPDNSPVIDDAAGPDNPGKPDKQKPVPATNVELVKKATVKMPGPPFVPPGQDKKKEKEGAATGILGDPVSGSRYAIVVGISDYPGTANDLEYCDDDAIEMAQALTEVYGFTNVILLTDDTATRYAILSAIESIPQDADEVVFFFSGHGMKGKAEDGDKERMDEAVVAHDGKDIIPIWDGELKDAFSDFATSRIIFVFDTCLAGGMKKDLEASGRVIAMATTEQGTAIESATLENGEFSYYFVDEGISQGNANIHDYDNDKTLYESEQVTVEEAWDYAKANCDYDKPTIGDYFDNDLLL